MRIEIVEITPDELFGWLQDDEVVLIDVREEEEFCNQRIPGSFLIPESNFDPYKINYQTDKKVVFYCRTGRRSYELAVIWKEHFPDQHTYHLTHGIVGWIGQGYQVEELES